MKFLTALLTAMILLCFSGCTHLPEHYPKIHSIAFTSHETTTIGHMFAKEAKKHPGKSGFEIIRYGREAFTGRVAMTQMAEKTLDLQYYLWERDETGRVLAQQVFQAADRGVKVRILLDDIGLESRDKMLGSLNAHPNIQIRIFNPFDERNFHGLSFLLDFDRVNHRMHNKTFLMDNTLAIVGGRNIGNHYFGVDEKINFRDLDIIAAGPVVRDISKVYDYFWNGPWSVPMEALAYKKFNQKDLKHAKTLLEKKIYAHAYPYPLEKDSQKITSHMRVIRDNMIWAKGYFVWDDPKQMKLASRQQHGTMIEKLKHKLRTVKHTLDIETPYFIPRDKGADILVNMAKKGVDIRILTNSQASNDVSAAFAGYEPYRKSMLRGGIHLFELRPDAGGHQIINRKTKLKKVMTGLHAKTLVFDAKTVFIGSFNLDPRSAAINTEGGLYVESKALAKKVLDFMAVGKKPKNAYKLNLDAKGNIVWKSVTKGKTILHRSDPHTNLFDQIGVNIIQMLGVEEQL